MDKNKIILFIIAFCLIIFGVNAAINDSIISYYKFDNLSADSINYRNLTATGGINFSTSGKLNGSTNSSGYSGRFYTSVTPTMGVNFTVSFWINAQGWSGQRIILGMPSTGDGNAFFNFIDWYSNQIRMYGDTTGFAYTYTSTNQWDFFVAVFNSSSSTLYKNGIAVATGSATTSSINKNWVIGGSSNLNTSIIGQLDGMGIWNRPLSAAEVTSLYNSGAGLDYPFTAPSPSLIFSSISLTNNTYFNITNININTTVSSISTNGNVNQTYILYNNSGNLINSTQYATNNVNGSFNLTGLSDGNYYIKFNASNNETYINTTGNYNFTKDTVNPLLSVNLPAYLNSRTINFASYINFSDINLNSCIVTINSTNTSLCNASFTFSNDGTFNNINVTALDLAGNSKSILNNQVIIDTVNPALSVNLPAYLNSRTINFKNYINFSGTNLNSCIVTINSTSTSLCNASFTFSNDGTFSNINVTVTDLATNSNSSLNNQVIIDTVNPALSVNLPAIIYNTTIINFSNYINFSDTNLNNCIVTINSTSTSLCNATFNFGVYNNFTNINVTVIDLAGNSNSSVNNQINVISVQAPLTENLLSYWTLNNNAIDTLGKNNLTISGVTFNSTGIIGNNAAVSNGGLERLYTTNLNHSSIYTINMWIYPNSWGTHSYLVQEKNSTNNYLYIEQIPNTLYLTAGANSISYTFTNTTNWYMMTFIVNGASSQIYINGNLVSTGLTGVQPTNVNEFAFMGIGTNGYSLNGRMSEVGVWNRNLSQTDITKLYYNNSALTYPFKYLTLNNLSLINNTYFNSSLININTTFLNTLTNANVNQTYSLYYNNGTLINTTKYATNNVNGSFNLSLNDNAYYILLNATNGDVNYSTTYNFTIDTNAPTINNNLVSEYNYYNITGFNSTCNGLYISYCNISINNQNMALNTTSFNFTANGNMAYNITTLDLAGNIRQVSGTTLINPYFYITFTNISGVNISSYTINSILGLETINTTFSHKIYDYGLGTFYFTFSQASYIDTNFSLTFNTTTNLNTSLNMSGAYVNMFIYDITTGNLITPSNFTLFYVNENSGISTIYNVVNNNTYSFRNLYASNINVTVNLFNTTNSLVNSRMIITPKNNISINLYITNKPTVPVTFQVLTAGYIQVIGTDVYLYVNIVGTSNFVLQTKKTTDITGSVYFDVVPSQIVYNICTYDTFNRSVCMYQKVFDATTNKYQLVYSSLLNMSVPVQIQDNLIWSYSENKTNATSNIILSLNDLSYQVTSFCLNMSRFTNNSLTYNESTCQNSSSGIISPTYILTQNQYIKYTFYYYKNNSYYQLGTYNTYYPSYELTLLQQSGILNLIWIVLFFSGVGVLLFFTNKLVYSVGILSLLLLVSSVQSVLNSNFVYIGVWSILAAKHLLYWYVGSD